MGKPLSRPDCLRQNPRCLGKGEDEEGYIEDCYVPQRSIYDTMRINEQIDQGSKLSQPSRSTLGSGGGEGSTLSSNGTLGADVGGVFVARPGDGIRKLDERVIFDALKLTGEPQSKLPAAVVGATSAIMPSSSASGGAAAVTKRRHQGGDRKDNPNRRSWKAFMPPTYPEFAERLELSPGDSAEKRLSGAGIPVSPLQPLPSLLPPPPPSSTPPLPPSYSASPVSSGGARTPPVSSSPSQILTPLPPSQHHPLRQKQLPPPHPLLLKQHKQTSALPSPSKEQPPHLKPALTLVQQGSTAPSAQSGCLERSREKDR
ncbi:microtubule-actin cross-linking factor 1, isoforms 6/7-like [Anguilla rostrata]|uniref:microtubule-actin cross-linking factor 1, isoforms 6/7-like n=1 Tax=Anguilla rostrata TaxID=7938 RepID=UPI0030CABDAC